ncbi:cobalamin binding intrinsic factor [Eudromia elegans]
MGYSITTAAQASWEDHEWSSQAPELVLSRFESERAIDVPRERAALSRRRLGAASGRMLRAALGVFALLGLAGGCGAPSQAVSQMLRRLEDAAGTQEPPSPGVLLALNLAGAGDCGPCKELLQRLKETAVERAAKDMTSGELALYVLAFVSSCESPRHVQAPAGSVDALSWLQRRTQEELEHLELEGTPLTTFYQLGLDAVALCVEGAGAYELAAIVLAKEVLRAGEQLSVDTRAVAALALVCTHGRAGGADAAELRELLADAAAAVAGGLLDLQQQGDGLIGDAYSTGLALQALTAAAPFYAPREWDCAQAVSAALRQHLELPAALAQLLPALLGRTYLDAAAPCGARSTVAPAAPAPGSTAAAPETAASLITVYYSVVNELRGAPFRYGTAARVPRGAVLLAVLQAAQEQDPARFSFRTQATSWGLMVVSIHGLAASAADKTYWELRGGGEALRQGVGTYVPRDGEHVEAVFSTY